MDEQLEHDGGGDLCDEGAGKSTNERTHTWRWWEPLESNAAIEINDNILVEHIVVKQQQRRRNDMTSERIRFLTLYGTFATQTSK